MDNLDIVNSSGIEQNIINILPSSVTDSMPFFIALIKAVGVVFLVYLLFQIISIFLNWRKGHRIKQIVQNLEEINHKLDILIKKGKKK